MLLTSILKSFLVYLYYLKKVFYSQDSLISKPCELENINFQLLINQNHDTTNINHLYQHFPIFIAKPEISFKHGVSSGDSSSYSSIFWTRITPKNKVSKSSLIPIYYILSLDESINDDIIMSGVTYTNSLIDFTVKLHIRNLIPNTIYYYKFYDERGTTSELGKVRTLPGEIFDDELNISIITDDMSKDPSYNSIDFIIQLNDYKNKFFTRLKDYRYRYSKEFRSSNITTLYCSNPQMYTSSFNQNDFHSQALLEWFPMRPPKKHLYGKYFEFGNVLKINVLNKSIDDDHDQITSTDHDLDGTSITHYNLVYSNEDSNLLKFQNSNVSINQLINLRDHKGEITMKINSNGVDLMV